MNIAFLGIGLMGRPMAESLINAGQRLFLFNRTKQKIVSLESSRAMVCDTPQEVVEKAETGSGSNNFGFGC